jgi:N-acetylmuramoyl-L-alanine amidase
MDGWDPSGGAIFFFNPDKTDNEFLHSREVITVIGSHTFCA